MSGKTLPVRLPRSIRVRLLVDPRDRWESAYRMDVWRALACGLVVGSVLGYLLAGVSL